MAFPELFEKRLEIFGEQSTKILAALKDNPILSVRTHPVKFKHQPGLKQVAWCKGGFYLKSRPVFAADPLWHTGYYYVQEASSMFIAHIMASLNLQNPVILDACAAPGGKSTLLQNFLGDSGLLVANEVIQSRVGVLSENLMKWGNHRRVIISQDTSRFQNLSESFDVVLVDAPCSGEGMFRKDQNASAHWSEDLVHLCSARQKKILHGLIDTVKEDGYLIYSTCTFNEDENEEVIKELLAHGDFEKVPIDVSGFMGVTVSEEQGHQIFRFLPGISEGEGFTCCILRKVYRSKQKKEKRLSAELKSFKEALPGVGKDNSILHNKSGDILAFPSPQLPFLAKLKTHMRVVSFGHPLYKQIKSQIKPQDELCFWSELQSDSMEQRTLSYEESIQVLMKETIGSSGKKGFQLATFRGYPLAILNDLGSRVNNNFPKNYRLRKKQESEFTILDFT